MCVKFNQTIDKQKYDENPKRHFLHMHHHDGKEGNSKIYKNIIIAK
jgi:hypothetical protein